MGVYAKCRSGFTPRPDVAGRVLAKTHLRRSARLSIRQAQDPELVEGRTPKPRPQAGGLRWHDRCERDPEADELRAHVGIVPGAVRRPAIHGGTVPAAAAHDVVGAAGRAGWVLDRPAGQRGRGVVAAPLVNVAQHVVQTPGVGLFLRHEPDAGQSAVSHPRPW